MNDLNKRLWESDVASSLTNEAARRIEELEAILELITEEAGKSNSPLGRSDSLALRRIRKLLDLREFI